MSWFTDAHTVECDDIAPSDRGITVPNIDVRCCTFEEYKQVRCSSLLALHYDSYGRSLVGKSLSLAEMLEEGYKLEVLQSGLLKG